MAHSRFWTLSWGVNGAAFWGDGSAFQMLRRLVRPETIRGSGRTAAGEPARIEGKHGAELNRQVLHRRRAPHRAGHECRTNILPVAAFVYAAFATTDRASHCLAVCSCAQGAGGRRSSAAVATAARCTAAPSAHAKRASKRSMPPRSAMRGVLVASGAGPTVHAAIGVGKKKSRIRVHPHRRRVICCRPTRWRCLATTLSRPSCPGGRWRTVIGAVVRACRCFARRSCAVVVAIVAVLDPPERSAMPHGDPT